MPPGTSPGVAALQCHPVSLSQCWVITCAPRAVLEQQDGAPLLDPPLCRGGCWNPPSCTQSGPAGSPPSLGDTWLMPLAGQVGLWQVPEGTEPAEPAGPGGGGRGRGGEGGGGPAGSLLLPEPPLGTSLRALIVTRHKDVSSCQWLSHGTVCSSGAPLASQQPHCGIPEGCSGLATALQHPRAPPGLATVSSACTSWTRKALEPWQLPAPATHWAPTQLLGGVWELWVGSRSLLTPLPLSQFAALWSGRGPIPARHHERLRPQHQL